MIAIFASHEGLDADVGQLDPSRFQIICVLRE
jgi:hypothetical protein